MNKVNSLFVASYSEMKRGKLIGVSKIIGYELYNVYDKPTFYLPDEKETDNTKEFDVFVYELNREEVERLRRKVWVSWDMEILTINGRVLPCYFECYRTRLVKMFPEF